MQDASQADQGSLEQIEMLQEINSRPETTLEERQENNRRIHDHHVAIEERAAARSSEMAEDAEGHSDE